MIRIVLPEGDHSADSAATTGCDMRRARAVAGLAPTFLLGVARILQEDLAHDGLTELSALLRMTARADLRTDIGRITGIYWLRRLGRLGLGGISRFRLLGCRQQKLLAFLRRGLLSPDLTHEVTQGRVVLVSGRRRVMR